MLTSVLNLLQVLRGKCCVKGKPKIDSKIINFVYFICLLNTSSRQRNCTILKYCIYKTLMALEKTKNCFLYLTFYFITGHSSCTLLPHFMTALGNSRESLL